MNKKASSNSLLQNPFGLYWACLLDGTAYLEKKTSYLCRERGRCLWWKFGALMPLKTQVMSCLVPQQYQPTCCSEVCCCRRRLAHYWTLSLWNLVISALSSSLRASCFGGIVIPVILASYRGILHAPMALWYKSSSTFWVTWTLSPCVTIREPPGDLM